MTQDTAAAERSAHVSRGPATHDAPGILVEVRPGRWQLRAIHDAQQQGYRAGLAAAATEARRQARAIRQRAQGYPYAASNAATLEQYADSLPELPGAYEPTGLEYRGG
jgi:hypothetical protein